MSNPKGNCVALYVSGAFSFRHLTGSSHQHLTSCNLNLLEFGPIATGLGK